VAYPVIAVKLPSSLAGQPNGRLPSNLLVKPGFPGRPLGLLHPLASQAWLALARDVKANFSEVLTVTSTGDAYRDYNRQVTTFTTRYTTTRLPGRPSKVWNGVTYWQKPGTAMAAVPGTSNHGWGLAVDTCLYRDNVVVGITANMAMFNWMQLNAFRYGLSWEAQSEPWHLRYWSGDTVPPAVKPVLPLPPTSGDDDVEKICVRDVDGQPWVTDFASYATAITEDQAARGRDARGWSVDPKTTGPWPVDAQDTDLLHRLAER
jgi:hypothetical protein